MTELTLEEAKAIVRENENSITRIINPEDLTHQDISSWEEVDIERLKEELAMSISEAWTYGIDHPYEDMIKEVAVNQYVDDMLRVPFDHLVFESREKCVIEGHWLFKMSREEVTEIVWENMEDIDHFHEYENEVMQEIESAIIEARLSDLE